jgi:iron complex outermembrane recepter protein
MIKWGSNFVRAGLLCAASTLAPMANVPLAHAQRTDDNAVAQAEDAFGSTVGDEQIGIYSEDNVRGFSPVAAGNVRIEGLYFDRQAFITDRALDGSTIHVGISAQGYPFPAPSGIADNALRKPGEKFVASIGTRYGPFDGWNAEVDLQIPIDGKRLGAIVGAGLYRETNPSQSDSSIESYAASLRWAPSEALSVQGFYAHTDLKDDESNALIFTSGDFLPNRVSRSRFLSQKWADFSAVFRNYGVVAKGEVAGFDYGLGVFRSEIDIRQDHTDLLFDTDRTGAVASRLIIAGRNNAFGSTSGEFKLTRHIADGPRRHSIHGSIRARRLGRTFGGEALIDLGPSRIGVEDFRAEPTGLTFGPKTRDSVKQVTFGLGYELRWKNLGEISLGLQKTDYRKEVTDPNPGVIVPVTRDKPWLFSATAAARLSDTLALYAGYVRGLEESDTAPANALNFNEAPPAIRTSQKDAGLRWKIAPKLSLVAGVFDVAKPYFNLDGASRFRQLGIIRNRGFEFSLAGAVTKQLSIAAATTIIDSKVSGEEVRLGQIGNRPVGAFKRRNLVNLNWKLPWHDPLTLTARFEATGARTANNANTFVIPARSVTGIGARYKLKLGGVDALIRANVDNLFNTFGWNVGGSGFFVPNGARRYSLSLSADL